MGISLQPISITSYIDKIQEFFNSQENNSKWTDLTSGSEGNFLTRFLANILSNINYKLVTARRENYLSTANLVSSNIGIAINLGYSVFRGNNQKRIISLQPNENLVLPRFSVIGSYNTDYDIINLDELNLIKDAVQDDIRTVIGKVKELTFTAGTNNPKLFQLFTTGVSEDFILYKDYGTTSETLIPTTSIIKELIDDKYLVRTNPFQSVDILYLNNNAKGLYRYGTETIFTLRYIELKDVPSIDYKTAMFNCGSLVNTKIIELFVPFESVDNIKIKAPLAHETQNIIRSKQDFVKRLIEISSNVITGGYKIITPTYISVSYLKDDYTTLSQVEENEINTTLNNEEYLGTPTPDLLSSKKENATLDIFLQLTNQYISKSDIDTDITSILMDNYYKKLNQTVNTFEIERKLESLSYVKYARVNYNVLSRVNNTKKGLGDIISLDNVYYKADAIMGKSGSTEPNWNVPFENILSIKSGLETIDNGIIWGTYKRLNVTDIKKWQANTQYKEGDHVYSDNYPNYMFKCVDLIKLSSQVQPDFSIGTIGDFIDDGDIVWVRKLKNNSNPARINNYNYRIGDSVLVGEYSYECIGYRGSTDPSQPVFELPEYTITGKGSNYFTINGDYTLYFNNKDVINAFEGLTGYTFSVDHSIYNVNTNSTIVYVNQTVNLSKNYDKIVKELSGTKDGFIHWSIISDINNIKYPWNTYNTFTYNLTTKI